MSQMHKVFTVTGDQGITVSALKDGKMYQRLLSWDELYKMALRGDKLTKAGFAKKVTDKANEIVKSNEAMIASNKESAAQSKRRLEELKKLRISQPLPRMAPIST